VARSGLAVSPSPRSGVVGANQPNRACAPPVKTPEPSSDEGLVMALPCSDKSKAKSKSNGPYAQVLLLATTQANGTALANSAASATIVKSILHPLEWHRVVVDGTQRVCERGAHSDPCASSFFLSMTFKCLFFIIPLVVRVDRPIRRPWIDFGPNIVRGCGVRRLRSLSVWRSCCLSSPSPSPLLPPQSPCALCCNDISVSMYCRTMYHACTDMF
jgi:hypothetical protein